MTREADGFDTLFKGMVVYAAMQLTDGAGRVIEPNERGVIAQDNAAPIVRWDNGMTWTVDRSHIMTRAERLERDTAQLRAALVLAREALDYLYRPDLGYMRNEQIDTALAAIDSALAAGEEAGAQFRLLGS